jgi:hypothetical protein
MALTHLHACRVDKIILKLPRKTKEVIKGRINLLEVSLHKLPLHAVETSREASLQCLNTVTGYRLILGEWLFSWSLQEDVQNIEAGKVPLPKYLSSAEPASAVVGVSIWS